MSCFAHDVRVERALVTEVTVPKLVDGIVDEFCRCTLGGLKRRIIPDKDSVFGLGPGAHHWRGVVCNDRVRRGSIGDREGGAPSGGVGRCRFDESDEVVCAGLVIGNLQKEGVEDFPERGEVIVGWLPDDGLERCCGRGKGCGDFLGRHRDSLGGMKKSTSGDNESTLEEEESAGGLGRVWL